LVFRRELQRSGNRAEGGRQVLADSRNGNDDHDCDERCDEAVSMAVTPDSSETKRVTRFFIEFSI